MGTTTFVITVAVNNPQITTMARGFCTSEPRPVAIRNGASPSTVAAKVISTGRNRASQLFFTASAHGEPLLAQLLDKGNQDDAVQYGIRPIPR